MAIQSLNAPMCRKVTGKHLAHISQFFQQVKKRYALHLSSSKMRLVISHALILSSIFFSNHSSKVIAQTKDDSRSKAITNPQKITLDPLKNYGFFEGEVTGYESRDYILAVEKNQILTLKLEQKPKRGSAVLEVIVYSVNGHPPRQSGPWEGKVIEEAGEYLIRVLMPRNFARREFSSHYKLQIKLEEKKSPVSVNKDLKCALPAHPMNWILAFCAFHVGTDDEIAIQDSACFKQARPDLKIKDECLVKEKYKAKLCQDMKKQGQYKESLERCLKDDNIKPYFAGI